MLKVPRVFLFLFKLVLLMVNFTAGSMALANSPQCELALQSVKNFRSLPLNKISLADWGQGIFNGRNLSQRFSEASSSGFVVSEVSVTFEKPFAILNSDDLKTHDIMGTLFPNMSFSPCASGGCRVSQSIGGFINQLDYTMDYRYVKIDSAEEAVALGLSPEGFKNKFYPKYVMAQLGTDWSKFFHRTVAVTVFEGDPLNSNIIYANAIQALNLTMVGSLGRGPIENVLRSQIIEFVDIFEGWAKEKSSIINPQN